MTNEERDKLLKNNMKAILDNIKTIDSLIAEIEEVCGIKMTITAEGIGKYETNRIQLFNGIERLEKIWNTMAKEKHDYNTAKTITKRGIEITQLAHDATWYYRKASKYEVADDKRGIHEKPTGYGL